MLFNSLLFLAFFPVVTALYFASPHRWRWLVLLAASNYFYATLLPRYLVVLWGIILVDFFVALRMERSTGRARQGLLIASIVANLGTLFVFKYANFFAASLAGVAEAVGVPVSVPVLSLILPLGLSFHTFQSIAYTVEVYRGRVPAERHLGIFALYVMFYPQLVAGPIERPQHLLPQFRVHHQFSWAGLLDGMTIMLFGFFKKVVVADRLALVVEPIYHHPEQHGAAALLVATYAFAIQIYCDFSGYTDIARGAAKAMGISLIENFNRPYFAESVRDFWRKWHMSLTSWFRDYVYLPLGGNREGITRGYLAVILVFLLSGLWHGANWTFVLWGLLHGSFVVAGRLTDPIRARARDALGLASSRAYALWRCFATFNLVAFAWIFFRAESVHDAFIIVRRILTVAPSVAADEILLPSVHWAVTFGAIAGLIVVEMKTTPDLLRSALVRQPVILRWGLYYATIVGILAFGAFENPARFIYFQF